MRVRHSMMQYLTMAAMIAAIVSAGCREQEAKADPATPSRGRAIQSQPTGYVVDSALPPDEMLRRFRAGLPSVRRLDDLAASSRDSLVARFVRAVSKRDAATLTALRLSRAEFADLYYPESQYTRPPYVMPPDVLWLLMRDRSVRGERRLIERLGGDLHLVGLDCEGPPRREGANVFYERCLVSYRRAATDSVQRRRLFGSILERDGRFKFVSYSNDF